MDISVKDDARQRIEKVVTEYRGDDKRSNYEMITRPEYALRGYLISVVAVVCFLSVFTYFDTQDPLMKWFSLGSGGAAVLGFLFMLYTGLSVHYKEQVWYNDNVSESDVLYLCANPALKTIIRTHLTQGYSLTYTFLYSNKDVLLAKIPEKSAMESWAEMISKIDQA